MGKWVKEGAVKKLEITSSWSIVIYTVTMLASYLACHWEPRLPFEAFSVAFTGGFLGILAKRGYNRRLESRGTNQNGGEIK